MPMFIRMVAVIGLALGLIGCQTFNVRTDWDPAQQFDVFQRYFWVEPPEVEGASPFADNTLLRKRVRFTLEAKLEERGFQQTEERSNSDFLVSYSVILEERLKINGYYAGGGGGYNRGRYGGFGTIHSTETFSHFKLDRIRHLKQLDYVPFPLSHTFRVSESKPLTQ